jgi:hypothetical protein
MASSMGSARAYHQGVGLDADLLQLLDRVLGGLGLELAARDRGHEGHVHRDRVLPAHLVDDLARRLEEGNGLHVADGAAHLDDRDVDLGILARREHAGLDLVGDVGDHLDRAPEVAPLALLVDDRLIDLARRDRVDLGERRVGVTAVVTEIEVRLRSVVGHVDLAVLVGAHRPASTLR